MESGVWPGAGKGKPMGGTEKRKGPRGGAGSGQTFRGAPAEIHFDPFVDEVHLGGRPLEVLSTPGHTPDSISLLDRANGLLFTGDTYYPAPIWLFRPETDLDAYVNSVKRLAALAPELKLVLGAHNIPVAEPSVLPRLVHAIQAVRSGQGTVKAAR